MSVPITTGPGICEQRVTYLLNIVDNAKTAITAIDCARSVQHSTTFHAPALAIEDMSVGK